MPQFRKKPIIVTAEQYQRGKHVTGVCYCEDREPHVHTMHGGQIVTLVPGDWVAPEPDGVHYYPIAASYVAEFYEQI